MTVAGRVGEEAREPEEPIAEDDFATLMGHLYRGEMDRTTLWRDRLDKTANWAVILTASLLTFAFSSEDRPHEVLLLGVVIILVFLGIESRRYRFYDVSRARIRLMEEGLFAPALDGRPDLERDWRAELARDLRRPSLKIPWTEALRRRLRRVYLPLLAILGLAWLVRVATFALDRREVLRAARVYAVPGEVVFAAVILLYAVLVAISFWPVERRAKGELAHDHDNYGAWKNHEE